ncbi:MAG: hypothetical protein ABI210_08370, partial [Abditibacteriaceae bacterium]
MLPFFFILAVVMYCVLYWLWAIAQTHPQSLNDVIQVVSAMFFVPGDIIFVIFRGILLVTAFYLLADFLYSGLRHSLKGHEKEEP